ncbi:MAG: hypothetical protein ABIS20_01915 [Thermoanaerobaculia bacterium]
MPTEEKILRILITTREEQALRVLLRENPLDLSCGGPQRHPGGAVSVEAYVPEHQLERLRRYEAKIDILDDASATARERQKEVGEGNRFEGEKRVPRGLGRKVKEDRHDLP